LPPPLSLSTLTNERPPQPYIRAVLHSTRQDLLDIANPQGRAWREDLGFVLDARWDE
jgi:hypothetical protein